MGRSVARTKEGAEEGKGGKSGELEGLKEDTKRMEKGKRRQVQGGEGEQ